MNILEWVGYVAAELEASGLHYGHGTDNPHDEAAWLVLHQLGLPLDGSFQDWQREVDQCSEGRIRAALSERTEKRVPLAYILGSAWFAGLEFEVSKDVLVPRSPIAELILERFHPWIREERLRNVLDLCTGSGCIGIAIAVHLPHVQVDASDLSAEALAVARKNVAKHGVEDAVRLFQSDLFDALPPRQYDLIVSNPPYVSATSMQELPPEYAAEPEMGLVSGTDGLDACLQIMLQSPDYLHPEGSLICEVGESADLLAESLPTVPFTWLEFSHGGSGVFMLSHRELQEARGAVDRLMENRKHVA